MLETISWMIVTHTYPSQEGMMHQLMHEVTPKVVAIAVSTVITMWRIFPQMLLFSIVDLVDN